MTVPVWLTAWQVAEDHVRVGVGDRVAWGLSATDQKWLARLFGARLSVALQLDTYLGGTPGIPSHPLMGVVSSVQAAWCRQVAVPGDGLHPRGGEATLETVVDTRGAWNTSTANRRRRMDGEDLYGYVIQVETADVTPRVS